MKTGTLRKYYVFGILGSEIIAFGITAYTIGELFVQKLQDEMLDSDALDATKIECGYEENIFLVEISFLILTLIGITYAMCFAIKMYRHRGKYLDKNMAHIEIRSSNRRNENETRINETEIDNDAEW